MTDWSEAPWRWSEQMWRDATRRVDAGRSLLPSAWPDGAQVAVAISFDTDNETGPLRAKDTSPARLSAAGYGPRAAVPRLMAILEKHRVPASFYVPAVSAMLHPEEVATYVAAGHEIALHGWIHEGVSELSPQEERELTFRSIEVLEKVAGRRPVGIRTPGWDFTPYTLAVLREAELIYDSSLMEDDDPYEILEDGEPSGIVEIPVEWIRDDAPYFVIARPGLMRTPFVPHEVLRIWQDEFEGALREGGLFQLTMHPGVTGRRSRAWVLDELLASIASSAKVWFATHEQVARHVRTAL